METHFKTLEFTDQRKDTLGKYVHIHDVQGLSFYGGDIPQLMPMSCTMEGLKSFYLSLDFAGIELVEKCLVDADVLKISDEDLYILKQIRNYFGENDAAIRQLFR
jgi:hypothetical protein